MSTISNSNKVMFYGPKDEYYELSNFYNKKSQKLVIDGLTWLCVEHYFQAAKFYIPDSPQHMEYFNIIHSADSPAKMAMLGRQKKGSRFSTKWVVNKKTDQRTVNDVIDLYKHLEMRKDWNEARIEVMKKAVSVKFQDNSKLKKVLLETGNRELVENSPRDSYWGIGKNGDGENMLGKILMEVRSKLV